MGVVNGLQQKDERERVKAVMVVGPVKVVAAVVAVVVVIARVDGMWCYSAPERSVSPLS